jgi:hypothetical protein
VVQAQADAAAAEAVQVAEVEAAQVAAQVAAVEGTPDNIQGHAQSNPIQLRSSPKTKREKLSSIYKDFECPASHHCIQ